MANELVIIETTIKEGDAFADAGDKYREKAADCLVSAGCKYLDAQRLCQQAGLKWLATLKSISKHTPRHVQRCMALVDGRTLEEQEQSAAAYRESKATKEKDKRAYDKEQQDATHVGRNDSIADLLPFTCKECGEAFPADVWHCIHCDHHWAAHETECKNCHEPRYTAVSLERAPQKEINKVVNGFKNLARGEQVEALHQMIDEFIRCGGRLDELDMVELAEYKALYANCQREISNLKLAAETQSPLPMPRLKKERDREDPSPDEEAATKLWRSYLDMPSKSTWLTQRFNDIKAGLPLDLKGQGDASFQVIRDYEAANEAVRALFDTKLRTQQSDKKHKGDDF